MTPTRAGTLRGAGTTVRRCRTVAVAVASLMCVAALTGMTPSVQATASQPDPFFGTWSDHLSMTRPVSQAELDRQRSAGVGFIRQYVWWDRIEWSPGRYDWSRMDALVTDASARGIQVLPTLLYTPSFYSSKPEGSPYLFPPDDPQTLARFATAMVDRYGTEGAYWCPPPLGAPLSCPSDYVPITYWEVWNEPDYPSWWKGSPSPAEYFELLKAVAPAIRAADSNAKVVLGSLTNAGGGTTDGFLQALYNLGAKPYFDLLSLNPYARDVGSMVAYIRGERAVAARNGDADKPIFITEYGWATGGVQPYIVTDQQCQAALLYAATKRLWDLRDELHIHAVAQFQWHDVPTSTTSWPHFAGVIDADDNPKPSLTAYQAAIAGEDAPPGMTLVDACPADRRSLDGELQPLTVTRSGSGNGAVTTYPRGVTCGDDCYQEFQPGMSVTATATADAGSAFVGWKGTDCTGTTTCTLTMDTAKYVEAVFAPVAPPGRYEQDDPLVSYTGEWLTRAAVRDSAGSSSVATARPASASLTFDGTGVEWVSRTARSNGIARVFIDEVRVARVDGYSSSTLHRVRLFDSGDLLTGRHTIRIVLTGRKSAAATDNNVVLDALVVR